EETDAKLRAIMADIYKRSVEAASEYGRPGNLLDGCNIAGFIKVADAMIAQGVV
ncbi:NADP-specific glutamate dehydrogenase, partial [Bacillus sp. JR_15]